MKALVTRFLSDEQGQDLIEYVLLGTLIALAAIGGVQALGGAVSLKYNNLSTDVANAWGT
jgi:Flp pilus assembly pilin Flp